MYWVAWVEPCIAVCPGTTPVIVLTSLRPDVEGLRNSEQSRTLPWAFPAMVAGILSTWLHRYHPHLDTDTETSPGRKVATLPWSRDSVSHLWIGSCPWSPDVSLGYELTLLQKPKGLPRQDGPNPRPGP